MELTPTPAITPAPTPTPVTITQFVPVADERVIASLERLTDDIAFLRESVQTVQTVLVVFLLIVIAHYLYKFLKMFF